MLIATGLQSVACLLFTSHPGEDTYREIDNVYVSLLRSSALTGAPVPLTRSATLFLFPLLTFTPKSVAVYRHSISVAPVDKRNFTSHLHADCYFRGS